MIFVGIIYGAINGTMKEITEAALQCAGEAVSLCISMAGIMAFWVGLMEIAEQSGLTRHLTELLSPFITFMFPKIPKGHKARDYISANVIANILGLGWACTPAGLKAMEELAKLEAERGNPAYLSVSGGVKNGKAVKGGKETAKGYGRKTAAGHGKNDREADMNVSPLAMDDGYGKQERIASNEMCTFLILNISSLQLIPVNMIAYRQQYGSINPAGIIGPAIVATFVSTLTAVVYCKVKDRTGCGRADKRFGG